MTRSCGTQGVTYGYSAQGNSGSGLHKARVFVNKAAAAVAAGKKVDLLLFVLDGNSGNLDTSFEGNGAVIAQWATAWRGNLLPAEEMTYAYWSATGAPRNTGEKPLGRGKGPTCALIATLRRIGWTSTTSPTTFFDDEGLELDCTRDPPLCVRGCDQEVNEEMAASKDWSQTAWTYPDTPDSTPPADGSDKGKIAIIDFASVVTNLGKNTKAAVK